MEKPTIMSHLAEIRRVAEQERDSYESSEAVTQVVCLAELQLPEAVRTAILNYSTEATLSWIACPTMRECVAACQVLTRHTGMTCTAEFGDSNLVKFTFQL